MDGRETLGNSFVGRERDGSVDTVDGQETVGNSLGRAPLGGSETEAWTPWGSSYGMERDGSVDTLGRWETVGNGFGRAPLGGSETEGDGSVDIVDGETLGNSLGRVPGLLARVFQNKFHQHDCSEKVCAQDLSKFPSPWPWDMHSFGGRERD